MSSVFAALGNIQCDVEHHTASFTFADVKMRMVEDLIFVDETLLSWEKYNQALDQLDAVAQILEQNKYQLDKGLMSVVNQDNQLGRLLGVYIPQEFRFEMEGPTTDATGDANKNAGTDNKATTVTQNNATDTSKEGKSVVDKAKELGKKIWEMIKSFFGKIAQGLQSFWQWIKNGFQSSKASNEKLLALLNAPGGAERYEKAVQQAKGFLEPGKFEGAQELTQKITEAPILKKLDNKNCAEVLITLNQDGTFQSNIAQLIGIDTGSLANAFIKVTENADKGLLPSIELNKEEIKRLKQNKSTLSQHGWSGRVDWVKDTLIATLNNYYTKIQENKGVVDFVKYASTYDWENSPVCKGQDGKPGADPKKVKTQVQALCKFYTQYNKLYLTCCNMWQDHLNAIKKYMNVEVGGVRTVDQNSGQSDVLTPNTQSGTANNPTNAAAQTTNQGQQPQTGKAQ